MSLNQDLKQKKTKRTKHMSTIEKAADLKEHKIEKYDNENSKAHLNCIVEECGANTTFCCRGCDKENPPGFCKFETTNRNCFEKVHGTKKRKK